MISVAPGSEGYRVLRVFAEMPEPTFPEWHRDGRLYRSGEIAQNSGVAPDRVHRIVRRLVEGGYLTGTEYRIANADLLARVGVKVYSAIGSTTSAPETGNDDADAEALDAAMAEDDFRVQIVILLAKTPMRRRDLAAALGVTPNAGHFARALEEMPLTNEPALTDRGWAVVEVKDV